MSEKVILVVDDEDSIRAFLRVILTQRKFHVLEAKNGTAARALVQRLNGAIDALVTDIRMPGIDGFQLAEWVTELYPAIPVVFVSGYCTAEEMQTYNRPERGRVFVAKPFLPKVLVDALHSVMDAKRRDRPR